MKRTIWVCVLGIWLLDAFMPARAPAQLSQLVSSGDPTLQSCGGGGDSAAPVVSRDGRYVLFASTANNLVRRTNNFALPGPTLAVANVFVRDCLNGTTKLVSVNSGNNAGANANSVPVDISDDGRYVLFESLASNLVPNDTNEVSDVFVRDLEAGTTTLVSVGTNGASGDGPSRRATMTPDGRYVAFSSTARNLVPGDTNGIPDVFVRDLKNRTTVLASVDAARRQGTTSSEGSETPGITPDGRFVVFYSVATNLIADVPGGGDIYVRDLVAGTTTWASSGARERLFATLNDTNSVCFNHRISDDGHYVAYEASIYSAATPGTIGLVLRFDTLNASTEVVHTNAAVHLGPYYDVSSLDLTPDGRCIVFIANTNGTASTNTCVCVWDAQNGAIALVSSDLEGSARSNTTCHSVAIDPSGRYVLFLSNGSNLTTNSVTSGYHVYLRDLQAATTTLIDVDNSGGSFPLGPCTVPQMSDDAQVIAFERNDGNLVKDDRNRAADVFLSHWGEGAVELISAHDPALPSVTPNGRSLLAATSCSSDGRMVAFANDADNLIVGDTNGYRDIFLRDLTTGELKLVSASTNGVSAAGISSDPAVSPEGRFVAFASEAPDVVPGDMNSSQDVFLREVSTGTIKLVSANIDNTGLANGASYGPVVSSNGLYVLFRSRASDVSAGITSSNYENLILRDMAAQRNYALTTVGAGVAKMTPDGRFVVYAAATGGYNSWTVYVWDVLRALRIYTHNGGTLSSVHGVAITPNGSLIAYTTGSGLYKASMSDRSTVMVHSTNTFTGNSRLTADGKFLACTRRATNPGPSQVYLYSMVGGAPSLLSWNSVTRLPGNGRSDWPDISNDGRFVAYRSFATDIVPGDTNGVADVFVFDLTKGTNTRLSSIFESSGVPGSSSCPLFVGTFSSLLFQSTGSGLSPQDFNCDTDIFSHNILFLDISPNSNPVEGAWLSWWLSAGTSYRAEYSDSGGTSWQLLGATFTNLAGRAWLQDSMPSATKRLYRLGAH